MKTPRWKSPLAVRLFGIGVVQLVLIVFIGDWLIRWSARPRDGERNAFTVNVAEEIVAPSVSDERALGELVKRLHARSGAELSIYEANGRLLASSVDPPILPEVPLALGDTLPDRARSARFSRNGKSYLLVTRSPKPPGPPAPLLNFAAGIAIVGIGAYLVARLVVRPLRRLASAARAFGDGDLDARARLARTDEIGDVGHSFDEMAERIEKLLVSERELLANVSHELRTPLARIRVALELASEGDADAARASLSEISVDLQELEAIIDDILTTTRLELASKRASSSALPVNTTPGDARDIVKQAESRFRARHPKRPLDVRVADALPPITVDTVLLRRAIDNLLENAHKYSPNKDTSIELSVEAPDRGVVFEVTDHGIGIPGEDLPHVFTAFFRSERSRSRGTGGVGLGLTLALRIAEAHGGTISVTSRDQGADTGSKFSLRVPAAT